ncbi:hypothetical protein GCM10022258_05640 [Aquimarina gracilis]
MILCSSCQEEEREVIDPTINNTIPKDSQLAKLMRNVVTHDGSYDDVIDGGNCFSINFPYMIIVNDEEIIVDNIGDYQNLSVNDMIEIQYPITITLFDHSEKTVIDGNELNTYVASCRKEDDDIECVDFVYPIGLSIFNAQSNRFRVVDIGHDSQMFTFMSTLGDNSFVSINYPIDLVAHNGQRLNAQHNSGLLETILDTAFTCEENDN